jgi:hypothetical protein
MNNERICIYGAGIFQPYDLREDQEGYGRQDVYEFQGQIFKLRW